MDAADIVLGVLLAAVLVAATVVDLRERRIPNWLTGGAAVAALAAGLALDPDGQVERLVAGALAAGFLLVPALLQPGGMGMGDVKLAGVIGLCVGRWVLAALLVALIAGTLLGLALAVRRGRAGGRCRVSLFKRIPEDQQRDGVTHSVSGRGALTLVGVVVGAIVLMVALFVVVVVVMASSGGEDTDCDTFRIQAGDWQSASFSQRQDLADGLADCGTLDGRSAADAERLLGAPTRRDAGALVYAMPYEDGAGASFLTIRLLNGRVDGLRVESDTSGGGRIP